MSDAAGPNIYLAVPPPPPTTPLGSQQLRSEFEALRRTLSPRVQNGIQTFGLEQKAVAFCAANGISHCGLDDIVGRGNQVAGDPRRLVSGRLSFEPIVYSYWRLFVEDALQPQTILDLGSVLGGLKGFTRTTGIGAGSEVTGYTHYPPAPGPDWPELVLRYARLNRDALSSALIALGVVLMAHPLADGNGRLARAMLWSRLSLRDDIVGPVAPIGFTMCLNPAWTIAFSADLGVRGDWNAFADRYLQLIIYSMKLTVRMSDSGLL